MADLVNRRINELEGIIERTKESLSWAQDFYNLDYNTKKKSRKNKLVLLALFDIKKPRC